MLWLEMAPCGRTPGCGVALVLTVFPSSPRGEIGEEDAEPDGLDFWSSQALEK